jgi:tRNA pseudouridine55 synthase
MFIAHPYVRSLANDRATCSMRRHLSACVEPRAGGFPRDATRCENCEAFHAGNWSQYLIPAAEALGDWPSLELDPDQVDAIKHGHRVPAADDAKPGMVRAVSMAGELVALMELDEEARQWKPKKVFFS